MARQKNSEIDAQLRALGAPTGAINGVYNEWEGLPFVEVVPGFLVLQQDLNDVILPAESREPINYDLEEFYLNYLNVSGNRAWRWRIEDGRFIASTGTCD
ncbi:hypothetical protein [Cronobacter sakazakii]|uniref:hypothetical protein n=1 Tax=Cronobacter sakazakii TaxID=28141 RepID=UPI000CFBE65E|nr:hypothetical protein [Cronobacter sakazakii]ELY4308216.1 hypothetical protein [Cronobacter sakazakii]